MLLFPLEDQTIALQFAAIAICFRMLWNFLMFFFDGMEVQSGRRTRHKHIGSYSNYLLAKIHYLGF